MSSVRMVPPGPGADRGPPLNVADHVRAAARARPEADAIIVPGPRDGTGRRTYLRRSFAALDDAIERWARGLLALGVRPGSRVLVMVTPSFELFGLTYALFRLGAVPVLIDPGMGRARVLAAIREVEPDALLGVPRAQLARVLFPGAFATVKVSLTVGRRWLWGGPTLADLSRLGASAPPLDVPPVHAHDVAAILYTSGSTGAPKGVLYTMAIFDEQTRIFREDLGIRPGEVDLSAFPLFSLFSLALGAAVVIPDMDATRPAQVEPGRVVESMQDLGVTYAFGSPAFWRRVAPHCAARGLRLDGLRRVLMAGAPAPVGLLRELVAILPPSAEVYTPYGATECLPISLPTARMLLAGPTAETERGAGTCVGTPLDRTRLRIIRIDDGPLPRMEDVSPLPPREIGEIMVSSPTTTLGYFRRPNDDAKSKVREGEHVWHRMGDVGYLDEAGRLWFCGRKAHRVETAGGPMYTEPVEGVFDTHPAVRRSALVGVGPRGQERPVLVVERRSEPRAPDDRALSAELLALAQRHPVTRAVETVLYHPSFPVDPRHNAKIIRELLAPWAAKRLGLPHR